MFPVQSNHALRWLLALLALFAVAACTKAPSHAVVPRGAVVLAFGDSVTHGTGAAAGEGYVERLAARSGWDIRNHGVPGDTAENARGRLAAALDETQPALVIVELGGNDFLRRTAEGNVKNYLRKIIQQAKGNNRPVVLVAVPRLSLVGAAVGALSDAPLYAELADEENVVLVADVFADVLSTPALRADAVHPNAEGYARLADGMARQLESAGLLAR